MYGLSREEIVTKLVELLLVLARVMSLLIERGLPLDGMLIRS